MLSGSEPTAMALIAPIWTLVLFIIFIIIQIDRILLPRISFVPFPKTKMEIYGSAHEVRELHSSKKMENINISNTIHRPSIPFRITILRRFFVIRKVILGLEEIGRASCRERV